MPGNHLIPQPPRTKSKWSSGNRLEIGNRRRALADLIPTEAEHHRPQERLGDSPTIGSFRHSRSGQRTSILGNVSSDQNFQPSLTKKPAIGSDPAMMKQEHTVELGKISSKRMKRHSGSKCNQEREAEVVIHSGKDVDVTRGRSVSIVIDHQREQTKRLIGALTNKISPTSRGSVAAIRRSLFEKNDSTLPENCVEDTEAPQDDTNIVPRQRSRSSIQIAQEKWKKLRLITKLAGVMKQSREEAEEKRRREQIVQRWDQVRRISKASVLMSNLADTQSNTEFVDHGPSYERFVDITKKVPEHRTLAEVKFLMLAVSKLKFFQSLTSDQTRLFCTRMQFEDVKTRYHAIFREGDIGEKFYVVMKGAVSARVHNSSFADTATSGTSARGYRVVNEMSTGEAFGGLALRVAGGRRTATVVSKVPCRLLWINRSAYNSIIQDHHEEQLAKDLAFVVKAPCMSSTSKKLLKELIPFGNRRRYSAGQCICKEGTHIDTTAYLALVRRGHCSVYMTLPPKPEGSNESNEGKQTRTRLRLRNLCPGDCITEASTFGPRNGIQVSQYAITVVADTCVEILVFSLHNLQAVLSSDQIRDIQDQLPRYPSKRRLKQRLQQHLSWKKTKDGILRVLLKETHRGRKMLAARNKQM